MDLPQFSIDASTAAKYSFFTGKGGVGKTSVACAVAVSLADKGKRVLLISTDPASNLQDVFGLELNGHGTPIPGVPGLTVINLDPEEAAREYRESVVAPYRGKLPPAVIASMEEQLSGSCTVEIAAFDQFSKFLTDDTTAASFDHILFDTAPTGHTLRMLQLPSAWSGFISTNTHGASCLGQLSGLEHKKAVYVHAVQTLSDATKTAFFLVSRPDVPSLVELKRVSEELSKIGLLNQVFIINGVLGSHTDAVSEAIYTNQRHALATSEEQFKRFPTYSIPLRPYAVVGIDLVRSLLTDKQVHEMAGEIVEPAVRPIADLIDDLYVTQKKVVFTMGKGGVGKTSVAITIAKGLAERGLPVLLATTDPANHFANGIDASTIELAYIDEHKELTRYTEEVLSKARATMDEEGVAYVAEDLRSPCTQEIAVFRAFADIVERADEKVVVIDTAPTGHTLLLLDATLSHHKEIQRTKGETPPAVEHLLPRLRDPAQTEVVIVTLPEATPVFEATRLKEELARAGIQNNWWVVNRSLIASKTTDPFLAAVARNQKKWILRVGEINAQYVVIPERETISQQS